MGDTEGRVNQEESGGTERDLSGLWVGQDTPHRGEASFPHTASLAWQTSSVCSPKHPGAGDRLPAFFSLLSLDLTILTQHLPIQRF